MSHCAAETDAPERAPPAALGALGVAPVIALATSLAACDPDRLDIDPFPIAVDTGAGPVIVRASVGDGAPVPAVLDTLSPHTAWVNPGSAASRHRADLTLWNAPSGEAAAVPRARFWGVTVFDVDPCRGLSPCLAGTGDAGAEFQAIIGTDLLADLAVSLELGTRQMRLYPDIPLADGDHAAMCKAVFRQPFGGGGTLVVGGAEEGFEGRRAVFGACMDFEESPRTSERGANALFVLSTGIGPTVLGESAYARYRARAEAPPLADLPATTLHLPSGPVRARRGELSSLILAGQETGERGPCTEIATHRVMRRDGCRTGEVDPCPCPDGALTCRAGAVVDLGEGIEVAVIADDHPILQALRNELRPAQPDVDGILGASALAGHRLELDYPNQRILLGCDHGADCAISPAIRSADAIAENAHCAAEAASP